MISWIKYTTLCSEIGKTDEKLFNKEYHVIFCLAKPQQSFGSGAMNCFYRTIISIPPNSEKCEGEKLAIKLEVFQVITGFFL